MSLGPIVLVLMGVCFCRRFRQVWLRVLQGTGLAALILAWGCASAPLQQGGVMRGAGSSVELIGPVRTVVVDAGHGGHDPGTAHFGLREKNLALDIAKRLKTQLEGAGMHVVMTRETDQFIPLSRRAAIANKLQADLFVSVHINANPSPKISGAEVYYPRVSVVSQDAYWPPSVRQGEVAIPSYTVKQVLWDLVLGRTRNYSRRAASSICRSMRHGMGAPCRGTKPARFVVLREAWMPAVLVEVGYVTNQDEAGRLASATYRQTAAEAIAGGILTYARELGAEHL